MMPLWTSAMRPAVVGMGVGVDLGGGAVRGPAGVGYADVPGREVVAVVFKSRFEHADPADRLADVQALMADADPGGVVAAIL